MLMLMALLAAASRPPQPNHEHWERYFQIQAQLQQAQVQVQSIQQALQQAGGVLQKDCGDKFVPGLDQAGRGACLPKPPNAKN